jgi:hypothetical protein
MELLERLDTVLTWLSTYSHTNPNFDQIKEGLLAHKLTDGEIDDCLKKLHKDEYLYFMHDNKEQPVISDVIGETYNRDLNYLITFDGKIFIRIKGGYVKKQEMEDLEQQKTKDDLALRKRNDHRLVTGTFLVAVGAIGLIVWEMIKTFWFEHPRLSSVPFDLVSYLLGITTGISLLLATQYLVLRKNKPKHK